MFEFQAAIKLTLWLFAGLAENRINFLVLIQKQKDFTMSELKILLSTWGYDTLMTIAENRMWFCLNVNVIITA